MSNTTDFKLTEGVSLAKAREFDFGLLANFVHQVINPLSGTSGHIGNIINGTIPESKKDQRLRAARAQIEHSISLMRNLAYFSQISLDPKNVNPSAVRAICTIPKIIIEAIQYYQEMASTKNISIEHLNSWDQYKVVGNPDLLRQVFMNMADNAVKYANPGSKIQFETKVQVRTGNLLVKVSSTGVPISTPEKERLFELGFRGEAAKQRVSSGTGLGLNICQTIIAGVHGGSIGVESSPDGKTTFLIKFPEYTKD